MKILVIMILSTGLCYAEKSNTVIGTEYNDELTGSSGIDEIWGGSGNDTIFGGLGADILYGGDGADTFIVDPGDQDIDEVRDFSAEEGDSVVINVKDRNSMREKLGIPKKITFSNVQIDRKGNVQILLDSKEWLTFLKLNEADLSIRIEDHSDNVRLTFHRNF